jgi:hypothetical protein
MSSSFLGLVWFCLLFLGFASCLVSIRRYVLFDEGSTNYVRRRERAATSPPEVCSVLPETLRHSATAQLSSLDV